MSPLAAATTNLPEAVPARWTPAFADKNAGRIVNPQGSIWHDLPMETGIATLVCYAGVFGDVIGIEEIAARLGVAGQQEFYTALGELHRRGKIIRRDGFAGLPDLDEKITAKTAKIELADRLIDSRIEQLRNIGRSPIIKFVGISGSLAAKNPVRDRNKQVDIDIFLITRRQCLWLYIIPRNLRKIFPRKIVEPQVCDSFIMDESDLEISNRNFFTATEIRNIIPVSGLGAYRTFLQANSWVDYYYPGLTGGAAQITPSPSGFPLSETLYVLFKILCCIRHFTLKPLWKLSFKTDPKNAVNVNRLSLRYGGYQAMVHKKFHDLAAKWFPDLVDSKLIEKLFPDTLSVAIRRGEIDVFKIDAGGELGVDYSKYA